VTRTLTGRTAVVTGRRFGPRVVDLSEALQDSLTPCSARTGVSVIRPGSIHTTTHLSERPGLSPFPHAGPVPCGWTTEAAGEALTEGADPIALRVVGAVRSGRFYVLVHTGHVSAGQVRADTIARSEPVG